MDMNEELMFLERLFLRVGMTDTDDELQSCLSTLLPQAINKLANPTEQVRNKVIELLTHINKRLKSRSQVQVPLDTLLELYLNSSSSAFVVNFSVIYIKLGFPRAPAEKRSALLPLLIKAAEARNQHRVSLVYLAVGSLDTAKFPGPADEPKSFLGLDTSPHVSSLLLTIIHNLLLLPYGLKVEELMEIPAELSKASCEELANNLPQITRGDSLEQLKVTCVKVLTSGVYTDKQVFPLLVLASADTRSSVFNSASAHLRKIQGCVDLDEKEVISPLYSVYMGSGAKESPGGAAIAQDKRRAPACVRLRLKLLPYMSKSKLIIWPTAIQVMFDSLYGEKTSAKLKHQALAFCLNMLRNLSDNQLNQVGDVLLKSGLLQLLSSDQAEDTALLRHVFPCIGLLVSKCHKLATPSLLQNLFTALINERDRDVGQSVRECLVTMSSVYMTEDDWMQQLVKQGLNSRSSLARLTALNYLVSCVPAASVNRVYLLLHASNHKDEEVSVEAKKALYTMNTTKDLKDRQSGGHCLPDFVPLLKLVLDKNTSTKITDSRLYAEIVRYLRVCLRHNAVESKEKCLEPLNHPCESTPMVADYLRKLESDDAGLLARYTDFLLSATRISMGIEVLEALIEVIGCYPDLVSALVEPSIEKFIGELGHNKDGVRRCCARIAGLVLPPVSDKVKELMETALSDSGKDTDKLHGYLMASAYLYERAISQPDFTPPFNDLLQNLLSGLKTETGAVVSSWCGWLCVVAHASPLPLSNEDIKNLVDSLLDVVFSTKLICKSKELACHALGSICLGSSLFPYRNNILDKFVSRASEVKDVELVLSMGECLVSAILGPTSPEACDPWTRMSKTTDYSPDEVATSVVTSVLTLLAKPHPNVRQCCCFWLLSIAKHCSKVSNVTSRLEEIQEAFMELLSDSSSLVQEASSKGLAIVYESGCGTLDRSKLVSKLVEQLTSGKRSVQQVSQDTKLFEEGQLGKSPTGSNLSTYKELCSLASDLNQPDLVYKFMNLANHNALWNSKRGAAFGVSTLADLAGKEMEEYLPKIIPKLYRYQFDPTPGIQQSMGSIWSALTANIPNVVEKFGLVIYVDLVPSLTSGQYRVRQSACKALADFIRSAPSPNIMFVDKVDLLSEVWTQLLRVMDDVHEATRHAATTTTKTLSRMTVRQCEKSDANRAVVAKIVLPLLLEKGISSSVSEVRSVSTEALCSLMKVGVGESQVVKLVPALLTASQHLDYSSLSHLSTMVSGSESAQEMVDSVRASAVKSHFTVQTLTRCVDYIKEEQLAELTPHLVDNLKSSVGLGTRLATCHFLTILSHTIPSNQIQPYIGKYLAALLSGLSDRGSVVRRQYALTLGQMSKFAKESSLDRLMDKLCSLYLDKDDEGVKQAVGYTLQALLNHHQEAARTRAAVLLPLAFYAKHQIKPKDGTNDKSVAMWEEICDDVGGNSGVIQHSSAITNLLIQRFASTAWLSKAQAGRSIKSLVMKVGDSLSESDIKLLTSTLVENLSGRSWEGKETLLQALASLAKYQSRGDGWLEVMERECSRGALCYRRDAVRAMGEALATLNQRSIPHHKYPALLGICSGSNKPSDVDDDDEGKKDDRSELMMSCLEAVGKAFPSDIDTQERVVDEVINLVTRMESSTRQIQVVIMSTVVVSVERLHPALLRDSHLELCLTALSYTLGIRKHTPLRKEALNLVLILLQRLDKSSEFLKRLHQVVLDHKEDLESDISFEVKSRLADIKQALDM